MLAYPLPSTVFAVSSDCKSSRSYWTRLEILESYWQNKFPSLIAGTWYGELCCRQAGPCRTLGDPTSAEFPCLFAFKNLEITSMRSTFPENLHSWREKPAKNAAHRSPEWEWSPEFKYPEIRISQYPSIHQKSGYPYTQIFIYPDVQMSRCPSVQMPRCPDIQMSGYPGVQMSRHPDMCCISDRNVITLWNAATKI